MSTSVNGNVADELSSSLQQLSINIKAPLVTKINKPYTNLQYVEIAPRSFKNYFSSIKRTILAVLGNGEKYHSLCFDPHWDDVCLLLLQERVDYIYNNATTTSLTGQSRHCFFLPKCLLELLNGIGIVTVTTNNGNPLTLCPRITGSNRIKLSQIRPIDESKLRFSRLVLAASAKGFLNVGYLTNNIEGSPWWALTVRLPNNLNSIATGDEDEVKVYGRFAGFSLQDELKCAIVQNQFDGAVPNPDDKYRYSSDDPIKGVLGLRETFNLKG